jgi:gliding motility-associated-like protein
MNKVKLTIPFLAFLLTVICFTGKAQRFDVNPIFNRVFDQDSLSGFDERAAGASAISEGFTGAEYPIRMYRLKREYIDNKYNLAPYTRQSNTNNWLASSRPAATPGCTNEDFEASTQVNSITFSTQIAGWTLVAGSNNPYLPTSSQSTSPSYDPYYPNGNANANSCNLQGCCPKPPSQSALIDCSAPGGFIDSIIQTSYPIYSVFGSGSPNAAAAAANPQVTSPMFGTKVIRINNGVNDYSIEKLSKTFSVTAQNALFQFAFISVFATGHPCCDAGAFQIKLTNASANTVIPCPNFSVSAPSTGGCLAGPATPSYIVVGSNVAYNGSNGSYIYNPWKINSMDLSPYIGQNITIDILSTDCNAGGHYGYVYFDAQCGPMTVYGNGNPYAADIQNVVVPTCGASGATICAASGLGPYAWGGPGVTANQTAFSMTNQCLVTNISATYTLFMQPQGACVPIQRNVQSTVTPAPLLSAGVLQATCGGTTAVVTLTPSGSASNPSSLSWSPTPYSLSSNTIVGTYTIPALPTTTNVVAITASDPLGCLVTTTVGINPAPPFPTFTIQNLTNSNIITCTHPTINLNAASNYSYNNGSLKYFWQSSNATFSVANVNIVSPGTFTVTGIDSVTQCGVTNTISIGLSTVAPTASISPGFQSITCSVSSISNVTLTSNTSTNITISVLSPLGGTLSTQSYPGIYTPGGVGQFTFMITNDVNGCSSVQVATVTSTQGFPTYSVVSLQNFTLGCNTKSVATIDITQASTSLPAGGPVSYTLLGAAIGTTAPSGTLSPFSTYTVNIPGTYTVVTKDNNSFCETRTAISILSNTFAPNVSAIVPQQTLNCYVPKVVLKGQSLTSNVGYLWSFPGTPGTLPGDTITITSNSLTPTATMVAFYTLAVTDNNNTCQNFSVVPMYQHLFRPNSLISNGGTSSLTCTTPTVNLTNVSASGTPPGSGFPTSLPVVAQMWEGPTPQEPQFNTTTYLAKTVGIYTMTAMDLNNGCVSTATISITDNRAFPDLTATTKTGTLDCGVKSTTLQPNIANPSSSMSYTWTSSVPASTVGGINTKVYSITDIGEYEVLVKDNVNGCASRVGFNVISGSLTANFEADKYSGYAPLTVNFSNTSSSTLGNAGVSSRWTFGNGMTSTLNVVPVVYTQPGTYSVTLYTLKGACLESKQAIIKVEVPSKLVIPNVFTPNNDGANDLFFLEAKNLAEINAVIYDRWGHIIYEVISASGNIAWDGKNQAGKDVSEGTYFYIIKATGKDGTPYDYKGTVNLFR